MDIDHIKTVLRVMNMTAPFEMVWVAERSSVGDTARRTYDVQETLRFWLVPDDSALLNEDGMIRA